jgi:hypothetical protein
VIAMLGGFGAPDDVAFDPQGSLLVIDLAASIHTLIRVELRTSQRQVLASDGLVVPQGLAVEGHGDIFASDERPINASSSLPQPRRD